MVWNNYQIFSDPLNLTPRAYKFQNFPLARGLNAVSQGASRRKNYKGEAREKIGQFLGRRPAALRRINYLNII